MLIIPALPLPNLSLKTINYLAHLSSYTYKNKQTCKYKNFHLFLE